ncbi:universal stress protein [Marivita sp. S0852]|uniref:universal stress protein n=1 Tax=Marivita sp. S0852 TaxID=3373893 RepID=UPI0039823AE1
MTISHILAAVDHFPQDEPVLLRALDLAQRHGASLTIVHVIDLPGAHGLPATIDILQAHAEVATRGMIRDMVRQHGADPDEIKITILAGPPALRLIALCDTHAPDLVVMRAHQRSRISEKILGSTTDRLIAAGTHPVLVVKSPMNGAYTKVMVTTDGTDDAPASLRFVETLLPKADLHLVQVVHIARQLKEAMLRSGTDTYELQSHRNALAIHAGQHLVQAASYAESPVKTRVLQGEPAKTLVRASQAGGFDLIVARAGRKSLIKRAFIGSVTRRLLRDAPCDVLIDRATQKTG